MDSSLIEKAKIKLFDNSMTIPESGCWIWLLSLKPCGYGQISIGGITRIAHRVSFLVFNGSFDPSLFICHKCDIRSCVNPDHLFTGTSQDNSDDCVAKNRQAKGEKLSVLRRGERSPVSKLTNADVIAIREIGRSIRQVDIAEKYGVSQDTISLVLNRKIWSHI